MVTDFVVDYEARQAAALANQKIDSHESQCAIRWADAKEELKTLRKHLWLAVIAFLGVLEFIGPLIKHLIGVPQ